MCVRLTRKGDVVCQACNYGPVIGEVEFFNPPKEPESLHVCSSCGKVTKYDEFPEALFKDWLQRGKSFRFIPNEYFWGKKLEMLCVCMDRQGIGLSITFVPNGTPSKERRIAKRTVLIPA